MSLVANLAPHVRALFEAAGWSQSRETRSDDLPDGIFAELGGLHVGHAGPGTECAAGDIQFFSEPRVDRCNFFASLFPSIEPVVAIADAHNQHIMLFLDRRGRFLAFTDADSKLYIAGESFAQCVERLLLGYRWDTPYSGA